MNRYGLFLGLLALLLFLPGESVRAQAPAPAKRLILLDPAHGGTDPGVKLDDKRHEKDIVLALGRLLQKELQAVSFLRVQLTRSGDQTTTVAERQRIARESRPDVFVSLHVNAAFGKKAAGYEVYFPGFRSAASAKNNAQAILRDMAVNKHLNDSVRLAQEIQKQMDQVFPRRGRGLREAPLQILEGLSVPALVLEVGFATNPEEKKQLLTEETQQATVRALGKALRAYF